MPADGATVVTTAAVRGGGDDVAMNILHVDCGTCQARGEACAECVISVLLGPITEEVELDEHEQAALAVMADSGLVPPLRLVSGQ